MKHKGGMCQDKYLVISCLSRSIHTLCGSPLSSLFWEADFCHLQEPGPLPSDFSLGMPVGCQGHTGRLQCSVRPYPPFASLGLGSDSCSSLVALAPSWWLALQNYNSNCFLITPLFSYPPTDPGLLMIPQSC